MPTYSSEHAGVRARLEEARHLAKFQRLRAPSQVPQVVETIDRLKGEVRSSYGLEMDGKRILEIGCGQLFPHALHLAQRNDVVAIDQSVVPVHVKDYVQMLRRNGPLRVIKTVGRKALGVDRHLRRALAEELHVEKLRLPTFMVMDAESMDFSDSSFDLAYSFSVFEHLMDPAAVLGEVRRVLIPCGVAYIHVHLFTSDSGAHDPRIMSGSRDEIPYWAHLRRQHLDGVQSNAYLNRWRVQDWMTLFSRELPGSTMELLQDEPALEEELRALRAQGELQEYGDDELLSLELIATWQKPRF